MTVVSYPTPIYQNLPINSDYYSPSQFFISAISLGLTTTITTTLNNNYAIGQQIRLIIPPTFGCRQLNGSTGIVINIPGLNQVTVNIDSSNNVDAFVLSSATTQAQILAIGDINNGAISTNGPNISVVTPPGAFINISPL